jgi:hypothetical protein
MQAKWHGGDLWNCPVADLQHAVRSLGYVSCDPLTTGLWVTARDEKGARHPISESMVRAALQREGYWR